MKVFISYSSKDSRKARKVSEFLTEKNVEFFLAERNIEDGDDWAIRLTSDLRSSSKVLLLYSPHVDSSKWVTRELELAASLNKPILTFRLEPVAPAQHIVFLAGTRQWIDSGPMLDRSDLHRLWIALNQTVGKPVWLSELDDLLERNQIKEDTYWGVFEHVLARPIPSPREKNHVLEFFSAHATAEQMQTFRIEDVASTLLNSKDELAIRVQQAITAITFHIDIFRLVMQMDFVLVPIGRTNDGSHNRHPFYLAECPINEEDWHRISGENSATSGNKEERPSSELAKTGIAIADIDKFLMKANSELPGEDKLDYPSSQEWYFALATGGTSIIQQEHLKGKPILKQSKPSTIGLYDLIGVVRQICHSDRSHYEMCGGSYLTPRNQSEEVPSPWECSGSHSIAPDSGFRPKLIPFYRRNDDAG